MAALEQWTAEVCVALGLDPSEVNQSLVLDVARDVAHSVMRAAAPLSAYLLGVAVGRGADPSDAAQVITARADDWSLAHPESG
jgi:prolyl-tRNA editing enzyme YbaK/EbsC (Cys-tRNA(Pro) deacylase)